jgi:chromosome segregation ATPase
MEEKDRDQIKLINRQSQETNRMTNTIQDIRTRYDELERSSQETEQEIEKIRGGAERVRGGIDKNTISAREVQELLSTVEELKKNPNVDPREYQQLLKSVEELKNSNVSKKDYTNFKQQLDQLKDKNQIDRSQVERLNALADEISAERQEVARGQGDIETRIRELDQREKNHQQEVDQKIAAERKKRLDAERRYQGRARDTKLRVDAIEPKVNNLPSEEELAQLKTLPRRVDDIDSGLERNDFLDNKQNEVIADIGNRLELNTKQYRTLSGLKDLDKTLMTRLGLIQNGLDLPESYTNEIDTLAERILGPQYNRFLE